VLPAPGLKVAPNWDALSQSNFQALRIEESRRPDPTIYASFSPLPSKQAAILNDSMLRQQRVISVGFIQCNTCLRRNALLLYTNVRVDVRFESRSVDSLPAARAESSEYEEMLANSLLNYTKQKPCAALSSPKPWLSAPPG
jgi:hypothetical protein